MDSSWHAFKQMKSTADNNDERKHSWCMYAINCAVSFLWWMMIFIAALFFVVVFSWELGGWDPQTGSERTQRVEDIVADIPHDAGVMWWSANGTSSNGFPFNTMWPLPVSGSFGNTTLCLDVGAWHFNEGSGSKCGPDMECGSLLSRAFKRYKWLMFGEHRVPKSVKTHGCVKSTSVHVESNSTSLQFRTNESYTLSVSSSGVSISAKTVFGAMYALESLSQLVRFNFGAGRYEVPSAPWQVSDSPRFAHRELLIDSSRHFLPMRTLKKIIASLPAAKINTLHWHIEDVQSFPLCISRLPELCKLSAFSSQERYSREDVKDVVAFAKAHGVRVMPELDIPGHTESICVAFPDICTKGSERLISPAHNKTFDVIRAILEEYKELFPDSFVHLGGDEVNTTVWGLDQATRTWMHDKGYSSNNDVYLNLVNFAHKTALNLGLTPVGWNEIWSNFGTKLNPNSVIHMWTGGLEQVGQATAAGYGVLWSEQNAWYLDYLGDSWEKRYDAEPCHGLSDDQCARVFGGGGEMWGETVDTSNIMQTVWPKLAAVGERLWSPRGSVTQHAVQAKPRLIELRCLLNRRGVAASPLYNQSRSAPHTPGSCFNQ